MTKKQESDFLRGDTLGVNTAEVSPDVRHQFPAESEDLGAWGGGLLIGLAEGVNDESAKLVNEFAPTRYELEVLARHYVEKAYDIEHWWESVQQVGSSETRERAFAWARAGTIQNLLGKERFEKAIEELEAKWKTRFAELAAMARCDGCGVKYDPDYHDPKKCRTESMERSSEDTQRRDSNLDDGPNHGD